MSTWLADGHADLAEERLLDAAGRVFATRGVARAAMNEVAAEAGCSRATVYRYFPRRQDLYRAFVKRETVRVGAAVRAAAPEDAVAAVLTSVAEVRSRPELSVWFTAADLDVLIDVITDEALLGEMAELIAGESDIDDARRLDAVWLIRVVQSLLWMPGPDAEAERRLVERFVRPGAFLG